jgi:hypothetical protein
MKYYNSAKKRNKKNFSTNSYRIIQVITEKLQNSKLGTGKKVF